MKKVILLLVVLAINSTLRAQMPSPPLLGFGESWTNLWSVSYDYQTNGSIRYIVQDPSNPNNLCAILMAQQDSLQPVGSQRYVYYSYSEDGGKTWTSDVLNTASNWGFPDMSLRNGVPIVGAHVFNVLASVFQDVLFGGFSFAQLAPTPTNIIPCWPHLSGTSNGNIVMAASVNAATAYQGYYATYNGTTWTDWTALPLIGGPSGNYSVESGDNGVVGIFGANQIDGILYWYKSTNNGVSFDGGTEIMRYYLDGTDTLFANVTGGFQAVFVGEVPHLVFPVYNTTATVFPNGNTTEFVKPKILHWSPSTGFTQVAGEFNIPNLADTTTTALMAPVGQPSICRTPSGKLICSFTTFLNGNTQVVDDGSVLNTGEIFVSHSADNGVSWTTPVNITNTPNVEEKHSSLIKSVDTEIDSLKIYYLRDMKAGGWVNVPEWGKAPVYGIYLARTLVGINNISTQAVSYELSQNYPNPFNPSTKIKFSIPKSDFTTLVIYDAVGKEVTKLISERLNAGKYEYDFSAGNYGLSSGVYYYKLISGDFIRTKQMVLIK